MQDYGLTMKFYRYEIYRDTHGPVLRLLTFQLFKETPKGYWITEHPQWTTYERWVSKTARKRWAYPTEKEALNNYIKRTEKRLRHLEDSLYEVKKVLREAKELWT